MQTEVAGRRSPLVRADSWPSALFADSPGVVGMLLLMWWAVQQAQYLVPHTTDLSVSAAATEEGSLFNTVVVSAWCLLGAWHLRAAGPALARGASRKLLLLVGAYLLWALVSLLWSVDPGLTLRRQVQLSLIVVGAIGLGAGYYGSRPDADVRIAIHVLAAGMVAVGVLWISLLVSGNVDLLNPTWAAKDLGAGTRIGYPIALALFSASYLFQRGRLRGRWFLLLLAIGVLSLFAQKVRFIFAFTLVVLLIQHLTATHFTFRRVLAYLAALLILLWPLGMFVAIGGTQPLQPLADTAWTYAALDSSGTTVESLTGRTPLWDELMRWAADRPLTGYGFGAFWNPEYMLAIWAVIPWHPPAGHDGFLDEALGTGLIGLALFLAMWLSGLAFAWARHFRYRQLFGSLVAGWMLFFLLVNIGDSIMQFYFQFPFYAALTGLFALAARRPGRT